MDLQRNTQPKGIVDYIEMNVIAFLSVFPIIVCPFRIGNGQVPDSDCGLEHEKDGGTR